MNATFVGPTDAPMSRAQVFLAYLDYFRATIAEKLDGLDEQSLRTSALPSAWSPLELVVHLTAMERRWLVWGFEGEQLDDPWADRRGDRWDVPPDETLVTVIARLHAGGRRTRALVESRSLDEVGQPSDRWDGADPPTLERILFHVFQEYARHLGHLDIVREMRDGSVGE